MAVMKNFLSFVAVGLCMAAPVAAQSTKPDWKQQFAQLSEDYFDQVLFRYQPTAGTLAGFHQYDTQLEDYSRKTIDAEIAALHTFERRTEAIVPGAPADRSSSVGWKADNDPANFVPRSDRE